MTATTVEKHFDVVAEDYDYYKKKNSFYYDNLKKILRSLIPPNKKVLEIGCGTGDLLNHLRPKFGYGYDISREMVNIAKVKHKSNENLNFTNQLFTINNYQFDYVFMSDVIEHLDRPEETFKKISKLMTKDTIFINTMANPIWEPFLMLAEKLKLKMPEGPHHRISNDELRMTIEKVGMRVIKHDYELLMPIQIPILTVFTNKYLDKYLKRFAFIEYLVAIKI